MEVWMLSNSTDLLVFIWHNIINKDLQFFQSVLTHDTSEAIFKGLNDFINVNEYGRLNTCQNLDAPEMPITDSLHIN
jgi:hypothetical protein